MNTIMIKLATLDEFDEIQQLFRRMFDLFYEHQNTDYPLTEHGTAYLKERIEHQWAYVAKHNERTIGFLTGAIEPTLEFKTYRECGYIQNIYVLETYRKHGIGRLLVDAFIAKCKAHKIQFIHTDSDANQELMNFYTGIGFKISGVNYLMELRNELDQEAL